MLFGGLVAFEMARQLERDGRPVSLVALFTGLHRSANRCGGSCPARWLALQARRFRLSWTESPPRGPSGSTTFAVRRGRCVGALKAGGGSRSMVSTTPRSKPLPKVFQAWLHEAEFFLARKRTSAGRTAAR